MLTVPDSLERASLLGNFVPSTLISLQRKVPVSAVFTLISRNTSLPLSIFDNSLLGGNSVYCQHHFLRVNFSVDTDSKYI